MRASYGIQEKKTFCIYCKKLTNHTVAWDKGNFGMCPSCALVLHIGLVDLLNPEEIRKKVTFPERYSNSVEVPREPKPRTEFTEVNFSEIEARLLAQEEAREEALQKRVNQAIHRYWQLATGLDLRDGSIQSVDPVRVILSESHAEACWKQVQEEVFGDEGLSPMEKVTLTLKLLAATPKASRSQTEDCIIQDGAVVYAKL